MHIRRVRLAACAMFAALTAQQAAAEQYTPDPAGSGPVLAALQWIEGTLMGTVATTVAVIAVAIVGLLMLTGRIDWRRAIVVVVGAFIVFGATAIVAGMRTFAAMGQ